MNQPAAQQQVEYVGFWARVLAALIDTVVLAILLMLVARVLGLGSGITMDEQGSPMFNAEYWQRLGFNQLLWAVAILGFWAWKMATPGKMAINAVIADANTLGKPTAGQLIGRYLGYFLSTMFLGLGLLWVAWDARKQGWHDKLAGTVVIKKPA